MQLLKDTVIACAYVVGCVVVAAAMVGLFVGLSWRVACFAVGGCA